MARARTTCDPFNAVAEPRRRALLEALAGNEMTVSQLVDSLGWKQPMVSKHLSVLKQVGLVSEKRQGRFRVYKVNAHELKPIKEWVVRFEQLWGRNLEQLEHYLNQIQSQGESND